MSYSNSNLVSYVNYSPNNSGLRTHSIDRITPHCVVGQCSIESLGNLFANPARQASSNYGIGTDGRIGLFVDEANRSWCSSSGANDQRAITIECASDNFEPYAFNDTVFNRLVELCVDICVRNGKNKIVYFTDKNVALSYEPKSNEMMFTLHRWFAATQCPGNWLVGRMNELTELVNKGLQGQPIPTPTPTPTPVPKPSTVKDDQYVWDKLKVVINNEYGVAGLMGNLQAESGVRSNNLQNTFEKKFGLTDEQYTEQVDNGVISKDKFVHDSAGYGLAQWTFWSRKQNMYDFIKTSKASIGDLAMQVDFLIKELTTSYRTVFNQLQTATSVKQASDIVLTQFEKPSNQSEAVKVQRAEYGLYFYNKYAGQPSPQPQPQPACPYTVKIMVDELNIRSGPGTNYPIVGSITDHGVYTIVEEQNGWGKLKSGAGWICLQYTKKR